MDDFNIEDLLKDLSEETENSSDGVKARQISESQEVIKKFSKIKVFFCVVSCFIFSMMIFIFSASLYTKNIRFPQQEEIIEENTGAYALKNFVNGVNSQNNIANTDNYLIKEIQYANSNPSKLAFIKTAVKSVKYEPDIVNAKNIYGNDMIDKDTLEVVTIESPVVEGEEVNFSYIDYDSIVFDDELLKNKIAEYDMSANNVKYSTNLVDMFCEYICEMNDLPIKTERRAPEISKEGKGYIVDSTEEIFLDKLLFSSDEFNSCKERFTEGVGNIIFDDGFEATDEWKEWDKLSAIKKEATTEPVKYGKYDMVRDWCGAYYLLNEKYAINPDGSKVSEEVKPELGDGTFENPASRNTSVITNFLQKNSDGSVVKLPIKIELVEFGVSEDAINYFQSKSSQNRGYNVESELQFCYAVIRVTNLSGTTLVIKDNTALSDKNLNISSKTGHVFGLNDTLKLNPDETGLLEAWNRSTELNKKYFIWGADFERQEDAIWFRVLAGDLEDTSVDKGVHIINKKGVSS